MLTTGDLKKGVRVLIDGDPYLVLESQTQTPSARGITTRVVVKIRNLKTGQVFDRSFKSGERFEEPDLDRKCLQLLYREGDGYVVMDLATFEQFSLSEEVLGERARFLHENLELKALFFEGRPLDLEFPSSVILEVAEVEAGTKGDTVTGGGTKGATMANGLKVQVPLFIKPGDRLKISTEDGRYLSRA